MAAGNLICLRHASSECRDVIEIASEPILHAETQPEYAMHDGDGVCINMTRLFRAAVLILMRDGADREMAQEAVRERLHPSPRFEMGALPSVQMRDEGYTPPPRRKDLVWDEKDLVVMKAAATPA